eukprot:4969519-Pyramimonas_sp.AAC.1
MSAAAGETQDPAQAAGGQGAAPEAQQEVSTMSVADLGRMIRELVREELSAFDRGADRSAAPAGEGDRSVRVLPAGEDHGQWRDPASEWGGWSAANWYGIAGGAQEGDRWKEQPSGHERQGWRRDPWQDEKPTSSRWEEDPW